MLSGIPYEWIAIGALATILAIDSLRSGIGRAIALALAAPLSVFLFSFFDSALVLKDIVALQQSAVAQVIVLAGLFVACFILLRRLGIEYYESGVREPIQSLLAAVAATAVVTLVWVDTPILMGVYELGSQIQTLFADSYRLWWILGSFATLTFVRG